MADERSQLDFQILRVQEGILLVIVSNCHRNLVHTEILEEHREIHDHFFLFATRVQGVLLHN